MAIQNSLNKYKDEIVSKYVKGLTTTQLANKYDVTPSAIVYLVRKAGAMRPKTASGDIKQEIYDYYIESNSTYKTAVHFSISDATVMKILTKDFGVTLEVKGRFASLAPAICDSYNAGCTLDEISEMYRISSTTARRYLLMNSIDTRSHVDTSRVYITNHSYFNELDNEKAYLLGLIFSFGVVTENVKGSTMLTLTTTDSDLILKVSKELVDKPEQIIRQTQSKSATTLRLYSDEICTDLLRYGISSNKLNIKDAYIDSFLYGYFNGNGMTARSSGLFVQSSKPYVQDIVNYLESTLDIKCGGTTGKVYMPSIYTVDSAIKLVNTYPHLLDKIKKCVEINPNSIRLNKIINAFETR